MLNLKAYCFVSLKVICLSPTYELALQTGQVAEKMGKFCPEVKIGYAVRGEKGNKHWLNDFYNYGSFMRQHSCQVVRPVI